MPRYSVLMPAHNRADVIGYAIRSVLWQTEPDFELLVVGDGCTDDTAEVVASFADPRIRWFDLPKAPHYGYANRNIALREARGELVAFAAHDDLLLPDHLALMAETMKPGIDWAYSRPLWVSTDGIVVPFAINLLLADELDFFMRRGNGIAASCVVHRRDCLDRFGYWPEDVTSAADWRLWQNIIAGAGAGRIAYQPVPTALHFSAVWKKSRSSATTEVETWLAIADAAPWWPPALAYAVAGPLQEQKALFEAIEQGGAARLAALRAGVATAIDRLAWGAVRGAVPRAAHLAVPPLPRLGPWAKLRRRLRRWAGRPENAAR